MNNDEYEQAVPYLEKALEYNPNSAFAITMLSDFYTNYSPNTEKYLEYALKGIRLDIASHDSVPASFVYLHLSNALVQTGFVNEAIKYINKSLEYDPDNLFSEYVKAYILLAKNGNLERTKELLIEALNKDTTRLDILQEVGKICYYMRDYESAYHYYKKFIDIRNEQNLDLYRHQNAIMGMVLEKVGLKAESENLFIDFKDWAENDQSIYKHLALAMYHSHMSDAENAIEHLRLFSQQDNYHYWIILFIKIDPLVDPIKDLPEFKKVLNDIETKFWNSHEQIKASLEEKELL